MSVLNTFHGNDPGDETRRYGAYHYREAGAEIYAGQAVTVGSDGKVYPINDGHGSDVFGVAYIDAASGEDATVKTSGAMIARVSSAASQGSTVGSGSTEAEVGALDTGGSEYIVVSSIEAADYDGDGTDENYAEVSKK